MNESNQALFPNQGGLSSIVESKRNESVMPMMITRISDRYFPKVCSRVEDFSEWNGLQEKEKEVAAKQPPLPVRRVGLFAFYKPKLERRVHTADAQQIHTRTQPAYRQFDCLHTAHEIEIIRINYTPCCI